MAKRPLIKRPAAFYRRVENKARRIRMGKARVLEHQGKYNQSLELWTERREKNPADLKARVGVVRVLHRLDREDEAHEELEALIAEVGEPAELLQLQAEWAAEAEDWAAARDFWSKYRGEVPGDTSVLIGLGRASRALGDYEDAETYLRQATDHAGERREAMAMLADLASAQRAPSIALERWHEVEDKFGPAPDTIAGRSKALISLGRVDDARSELIEGIELYPGARGLHRSMAEIAQTTCDFETWAHHLNRLIYLQPNNTFLRAQRALAANNLGDIMLYWRDLDFATDRYRREAWAGQASGLANLIDILLRKGEYEEAQELLPPLVDRCLTRPSRAIIKSAANALIWVGDIPGLRFLTETIDVDLCSPAAKVELANALIATEDHSRALELIDGLTDVESRRARELRAWAAIHRGDRNTAVQIVDELSYPNTLNYFRALSTEPLGELHAVRCELAPGDLGGQVVALSVCRNEMDRLPGWFEHYRSIGVRSFIFVDNASTDGTTEYLLDQPDVQVFSADGYYRHTASGRRWLNEIMATYCDDAWCLIADADEFMVFPHMDQGIDHLARYLDSRGAETMFAIMLDMFGERLDTWNDRTADSTMGELFPFFDSRTHLVGSRSAPYLSVSAGMRNLVLSKVMPESLLSKPAMIKGGRGIMHLTSHITTPCLPADVTGTFLHYKFAVDPKPRSTFSSSKGVFARLLASDLATTRELDLKTDWSVRYSGPEQLVDHGLLRTSESFDAF